MENRLYKKLILGSANLNHKYGLNKNIIKKKEFKKIINFLSKKGNVFLDTAAAYNNAENIIGGFDLKNINIITKIEINNKKKDLIENEILEKILQSKSNFKNNEIYALLIHNPECLLSDQGKNILRCLQKYKNQKFFKKIGISIYNFKSLKILLNKYNFDVVQLPTNIFDQRMNDEKILGVIKKKKIEIHARSIFLQGTLLKKNNKLRNIPLRKNLNQWHHWLKTENLKPLNVCVSSAIQNKDIDKIVVGFDNYLQFKEYLKVKLEKNNISFFKTNNQKIINPNLWH